MAYSCSDFTDDVMLALNVALPDCAKDDPEAQATIAIARIENLQNAIRHALPALRLALDRLELGDYDGDEQENMAVVAKAIATLEETTK